MLADLPLFFVFLLIFIWLAVLTFLTLKVYKLLLKLTKGVSEKDLKEILEEILDDLKKGKSFTKELEEKLNDLKTEEVTHIQKVGLVRYNPFSDTGGNQSFVLSILDGQDNGLVITSLHSRDSTRVFAKPVSKGKESGFEFSKEEIQSILEAQKLKNLPAGRQRKN